jgi:hypothetical protein
MHEDIQRYQTIMPVFNELENVLGQSAHKANRRGLIE